MVRGGKHGPTANPVNDKREIFGWAMYDWANSAFSTTVGTVFLGPYVASLAADAAKGNPDGLARLGGLAIAPDSFFPACISLSVIAQVFVLPILGAIADYSHRRKQMLQVFATLGALLDDFDVPRYRADLVARGSSVLRCEHRIRSRSGVLQRLSSGHRQRGPARPGLVLRLGNGLPRRRDTAGPESGILHVPRAVGRADLPCHSDQPGLRRCVVAEFFVYYVGAAAAQARASEAAAGPDLSRHWIHATGADTQGDSPVSRDNQVPACILPVQRRHPDRDRGLLDICGRPSDPGRVAAGPGHPDHRHPDHSVHGVFWGALLGSSRRHGWDPSPRYWSAWLSGRQS